MLSGLAGFDVQAFDPVVEIRRSADQRVGLAPSDFGYNNPNVDAVNLQFGGYVDLGIGIGNGLFTAGPLTPTTTGTGGLTDPFADIRPYRDDEVEPVLARLLQDTEFLDAIASLRLGRDH